MANAGRAVEQAGSGRTTSTAEKPGAGDTPAPVPIVGIGASAGGLEAMKEFLAATPSHIGACFVFVQHLDPGHKSMLTELLARSTEMTVRQAEDGMAAAPNELIIIPPDTTLTTQDGAFRLQRPAPPRAHRTPIDSFFHSLAKDQGDKAIAIVLSGTGSDGTQGLKAVKEAGGFALIQEPSTAKYDSMPRSAQATGLVDQALPVADMPAHLTEYLDHIRRENEPGDDDQERRDLRSDIARICGLLKIATGHEFREYKEPTFVRRIQRRMQVLRLREMGDYIERLREDQAESRQLFRDLLVSVTAFFRDAKAFEALDRRVLTPLLAAKEPGESVRVWVPGCATGEEAYSIAMALHEKIEHSGKSLRVQVFATDLDEGALEAARRAIYPEGIAAYVPDHLLKRYFRVGGAHYQVVEEIRQLCIFSTQSLIKDPPFSRLDLISCRNVLIYFKAEMQNRLIPVFHYALRPGGFLFLGPSESVSRHPQLFRTIDKKWRIFRRTETTDRPQVQSPLVNLVAGTEERDRAVVRESARTQRGAVISLAERAILDHLGPAYAVVGENRELVHSGGPIESYLKLKRGAPSFEIVAISHESLRMDVRAILHRAIAEQAEVVRENLSMETPQGRRRVTLLCRPLGENEDTVRHYLIVFRDLGRSAGTLPDASGDTGGAAQVQALEREIRATKEYLQTTTEELESSNEELKSANEELMSMNEELQSSNQELETSKEELQSVNEELQTVNAELVGKVDELGRSNADLQNLLESTQIATLFLDRQMRVRRFTPLAKEIFHLIDRDLGRPITDITARVDIGDIAVDFERVFDRLGSVEREVKLRDGGATYMMRLLPYRTSGGVIDGVVVTFVDVTGLKAAQQTIDLLNSDLQGKVEDLQALLDLAPIGIAFADDQECTTIDVNRYGARIMNMPQKVLPAGAPAATYRLVRDGIEVKAEDLPLQKAWRTGKSVRDFRATYLADNTAFEFLMSAAPVLDREGKVRRVIGIYDDITRLVEAQAAAEVRAAQQDFVAKTGSLSLRGQTAKELIAALPKQLGRTLGVELVKVLLFQPETGDFRLEAGIGFDRPVGTIVPGGLDSQAGYTVEASSPIIVESLAEEKRFTGPALLREAGVVSGISVIIGDPEHPWGVIGVHTRTRRAFTADDIQFLQSIANVVAATLQRDVWQRDQRLLLDELRHRVKNSLATVLAIAALTFGRQPVTAEAVEGFTARLHSLSRTQDLRFESDGHEVDFGDLIRRQVEPFGSGDRIRIDGPSGIRLAPNSATDLAMALHELLTNAAKHGALATERGAVRTTWRRETRGDGRVIVFDWIEEGGPAVEPPASEGVGSKVLQAIAQRPQFKLDRRFEREGLHCRIEVLLDEARQIH
jgi:two-component system CheB/CheR fusion protein